METEDEDNERQRKCNQRTLSMPAKGRRRIRPRSRLRNSFGSSSGCSSSGSLATDVSESTTTDIYFIYNPSKQNDAKQREDGAETENRNRFKKYGQLRKSNLAMFELGKKKPKLSSTSTSASVSSDLSSYTKHSNLDVHALSLREHLRLARIQHCRFKNAIRIALVLFCVGWFLFNAITILSEYVNYETMVYMEFRSPSKTLPPGITICAYVIQSLNGLNQ